MVAVNSAVGANPENLCETTGVDRRSLENILHHDSHNTCQKALAGIAVMDPQTFNDPDEAIPRLPRPGFLWPGAYARVFLCGLSG